MLNKLFQSKEDSNREKVDVLIKSGIKLLSEKFFNRAMIEFDKAMAVSREEAYPKLKKELENVANSGSYESALSIGLNMMKDNTTDFELANKLGNFARQLKNYPQAEGLYKQALKINKNYEKAFYNLAASMARINKYDEALISSVSIFDKVTDYILPDYIGPKDIIEKMTEKLMDEKEEATTQKLQVLTLEKDNKEADGESVAVSELEHEIKLLTEKPIEIKPVDVINGFRKEIEEDPEHALNHRFNLALYAIRNKQPDVAEQAIKDLSSDDYETLDLLKALILDVQGKKEDAANLLIKLLGKNEFNRYYNVNLGLLYKKAGKKFLSIKYLIKTAGLLEKSNGLYSMNDLLAVADENYTTGNLKKALNFYKIAATEIPTAALWEKIGTIFITQKKYDEAAEAFRCVKKCDPESNVGDEKLREIHDYYANKGEVLMLDRKFKASSDYYHKALGILRLPETLKVLAGIYKEMKNPDKEKELMEEWNKLLEEEKSKEMEKERQNMILVAKQFMSKKDYRKAIETYESIFRMKLDKNIFLQLATIYKGLKKQDDLQSLIQRWEKMVEHQEKMEKFEKEKERMQQT